MKAFTVCFMVTGGITVEAETEEEAIAYLDTDGGQEAICMCLAQNDLTVTEVYKEEDWDSQ